MRIKQSMQLAQLAFSANQTPKSLSDRIVSELISRKIIEDVRENWGAPLADCVDRDINMSHITEVMDSVGLMSNSVYFADFIRLVIMGDGECAVCGGDMDVVEGHYLESRGDYDSEPEYTAVWERKRCTNCSYEYSDEPYLEREKH